MNNAQRLFFPISLSELQISYIHTSLSTHPFNYSGEFLVTKNLLQNIYLYNIIWITHLPEKGHGQDGIVLYQK